MPNPRTPSTDDFSTLETQKRNDNTTTSNSTTIPPEYPDRSNGNEFEVERRNEVHPGQTHERELTETEQREKKMDNTVDKDEEDWDITKNKNNPETQNRYDRADSEREKTSSGSTNDKPLGNE